MTRQSISSLLLAATVCAAPSFHGCSLVGFIVGAGIDGSIPDRDMLQLAQFSVVKKGEDVEVILRSGAVVSGSFVTFDTLTATEYATNYNAHMSRDGGGANLPLLGDSVTLLTTGAKGQSAATIGGELVGFDVNVVALRRGGKSVVFRTRIFQTITDGHGHVIDQDTFHDLMEEGRVPLMTAAVVETSKGEERLPVERVRQIVRFPNRNNRLLFAGFGFAIDAAVAFLVLRGDLFQTRASSF